MINIVEKENIKYRHLPSTSVARPQWPCFCTHLYSHKMSKWIFNGLKLCCKQHNIIKQKNIIIANCPVFLQWQWRKTAMTKWSYEKYLLFNLWKKNENVANNIHTNTKIWSISMSSRNYSSPPVWWIDPQWDCKAHYPLQYGTPTPPGLLNLRNQLSTMYWNKFVNGLSPCLRQRNTVLKLNYVDSKNLQI